MSYAIFKYLWLIAMLPKMVQLPILGAILICLYGKDCPKQALKFDFRADRYFTLLIVCNAVYGFSIVVNVLSGQYELSRILAAGNTFAITCVALGFYHFYSTAELEMERVEQYMSFNMNILFGLCVLYWLIGSKGNLPFIGQLSGWDKVIKDVNIGGEDTTRFLGYLEYPNLTVFMYLYCYAFSVNYLSKKVPKVVSLIVEVLYALPLAAANSRAGVACAIAMTAVSLVLTKVDRVTDFYLKNKAKSWGLGIAALAVICLVCYKPIGAVLQRILLYRGGSTITRSIIYGESIGKMLSQSPVWGCGIKAIIPELGYPYGSHSTYLGMFYKAGILGGTIYLIATLGAVIGIIRRKENSRFDILMSFTFLALFAFAVLEDIDGANWNIVMFMSLLAACVRHRHSLDVGRGKHADCLQNEAVESKACLEKTEQA